MLKTKIKEITVGKVLDKTLETTNVVVQIESHEGRATGTQTEPIPTQPVIIQEEHLAIFVDIATQIEDVPSHSMATQIEAWTSHDKETQTRIQAKYIMTHEDPIILNLQKELAQARLALEWLEQETIPQQRYQALQRQLQEMNATESETFDRYRKSKEKRERIKLILDRVIAWTYTICSLYTNFFTCRAPPLNMPCFCQNDTFC